MPRRLDHSRYLAHLGQDSARFVEVLNRTSYENTVPTCPGWNAADLLFHLAEVQAFWARIVGRRLTTAEEVGELTTIRPDDAELPAMSRLDRVVKGRPPVADVRRRVTLHYLVESGDGALLMVRREISRARERWPGKIWLGG
jgi:hypothetical protein